MACGSRSLLSASFGLLMRPCALRTTPTPRSFQNSMLYISKAELAARVRCYGNASALKASAHHGKQSSEALFVGDSISLQYYRTFADWPEGSNRKSQRLSPSATESTIAYIKARPTQPQIHHRGNATQKEVVAPKSPRALAAATSAPRWHVYNRCPIQNGDAT